MRTEARTAGASLAFPEEPFLAHPRVLAGVDEAGLGPLLGPLTIGYSAFRVRASDLDLWSELRAAVSRRPGRTQSLRGARVVVADSKIVFDRTPVGEARLEASALSFLALLRSSRRPPASAREMIDGTPPELRCQDALEGEPWFHHLPERLPRHVEEERLDRSIAILLAALQRSGVEVTSAGARLLPVSELNASFERTSNKARSHWDACAPVLRHLWNEHAREGLDLEVDRHGGRMRYGPLLSETFPEARVRLLDETRHRSEYALVEKEERAGEPRRMRVAFSERADSASFAVALASCIAKYARETCMHAFNAYFGSLQPGLRRTAGYFLDGKRWLREAGPAIARSGIGVRSLVRER